MSHKHLITLYDSVFLVFQIHYSLWQSHSEFIFHLVAKGVDKNFDIYFVRRGLIVEVGVFLVFHYVIDGDLYCFVP